MIVHDAKCFSSYIRVIALNNHLDACEEKRIVEGSRNFFTQFLQGPKQVCTKIQNLKNIDRVMQICFIKQYCDEILLNYFC